MKSTILLRIMSLWRTKLVLIFFHELYDGFKLTMHVNLLIKNGKTIKRAAIKFLIE